jgi:hypothetical protein
MKQLTTNPNKGFALLLALIVSGVVLAIGIAILQVSVNQINLSATARESEYAFQAAHAGMDCQIYWRSEKANEYLAGGDPPPNPAVSCFGGAPIESSSSRVLSSTDGTVDYYYNAFAWGTPERCSATAMYILKANQTSDLVVEFASESIGDRGTKRCLGGNTCTVLIADGYNRSCDEVAGSIFSVQRELTVEF